MHTRGVIFHHRRLVFHNGFVGKKYLILLNTPSGNEPYLLVKTTSQKKDKPTHPGCIKKRSLFFIPADKTFFPKDTWIQLFEIYPIPPEDIESDKNISIAGNLDAKLIDDIVNCLFEAEQENIPLIYKKL